jgi:hypothetical protein
MLTAFGTVLSGFALLLGFGATVFQMWENRKMKRRKEAQYFIVEMDSKLRIIDNIAKINKVKDKGDDYTTSEFVEEMENDDSGKMERDLLDFLNLYEAMAVGVRMNLLDEDIMKLARRGVILSVCKTFGSYIDRRREKDPEAYVSMKHVVEMWSKNESAVDLGRPHQENILHQMFSYICRIPRSRSANRLPT